MSNDELELVKEFERLVAEGGAILSPDLELRYDCDKGFHKWTWYRGFHVDRFYYCELCDAKDRKRPPPPDPKYR